MIYRVKKPIAFAVVLASLIGGAIFMNGCSKSSSAATTATNPTVTFTGAGS